MMQPRFIPRMPSTVYTVWHNTGAKIFDTETMSSKKQAELFLKELVKQIAYDFNISEDKLKEKGYL